MPERQRELRPTIHQSRDRVAGSAAHRFSGQAVLGLDPPYPSIKLALVVLRRVYSHVGAFVSFPQLREVSGDEPQIMFANRRAEPQCRVGKEGSAVVPGFTRN